MALSVLTEWANLNFRTNTKPSTEAQQTINLTSFPEEEEHHTYGLTFRYHVILTNSINGQLTQYSMKRSSFAAGNQFLRQQIDFPHFMKSGV
jgi:hypothetical protein